MEGENTPWTESLAREKAVAVGLRPQNFCLKESLDEFLQLLINAFSVETIHPNKALVVCRDNPVTQCDRRLPLPGLVLFEGIYIFQIHSVDALGWTSGNRSELDHKQGLGRNRTVRRSSELDLLLALDAANEFTVGHPFCASEEAPFCCGRQGP